MTLDEIKEKYKNDADLFVWDGRNSIDVSRIVVNKDKRNQGIGTAIMNDIIAYAKSVNKPVSLSPSKDFGGKIGKLREFYGNLGFKPNKGRHKDFTISNSMIKPVTESNMNQLRTFIESFSNENELLISTIIEGLDAVTEDQPFDVKTFKTLPSFAARTRYARSKLPLISNAGSSRIVFDLGNDKVLKLAKNAKGIAQNGVEDDGYVQQSGIASTVYDSDDESLWIISDKVDNVTEKEFGQLLGVPFKFFCDAVLTHEVDVRGNSRAQRRLTSEQMQPLWENEFICDIFDLMGSMDLLGGDLTKLGSYGKCKGELKLRDAGFTKTVAKEHYSNKGKFESVEKKEYLIGGRADGMTPEDIARKHGLPVEDIEEQLEIGDDVEKEHSHNQKESHEIAGDHVSEIPDYYTRLNKMEKQAGITEGQGWYPPANKPKLNVNDMSNRDKTIFAIMSMFKAMSPKHKQEFLKNVEGVTKWQLDKYPDNYLIRIKMDAEHIRDIEKDMIRKPTKQPSDKQLEQMDKYNRQETKKYEDEFQEWRKIALDKGEIDQDGNFLH